MNGGDVTAGGSGTAARFSMLEAVRPSLIRRMSALSQEHGAIDLVHGAPDFACPVALKRSAAHAIDSDVNQYAISYGSRGLREAIAGHVGRFSAEWDVDPATELCVTCGSTGGLASTLLALLSPGDEVVVIEPAYDGYVPAVTAFGGIPRFARLDPRDWSLDEAQLKAAFNDRTAAILVNTPHNPTGRVLRREELLVVSELCNRYDAVCISDEVYQNIHYLDTGPLAPVARVPGLEDRTISISSLSKTFAVTGWRVGWAIASAAAMESIRKAHDLLTAGAPAPLQIGGVAALTQDDAFYDELTLQYTSRRDLLCHGLDEVGLACALPEGATYAFCETTLVDPDGDDVRFAGRLVTDAGVGVLPGSNFFEVSAAGRRYLRVSFARSDDTILEALDRLRRARLR